MVQLSIKHLHWVHSFQHGIRRLQKECNFVNLVGDHRFEHGVLESGPVLLMALAHVALELRSLVVSASAEAVRTFEWVLALVAELTSN